MTDTNRPPRMVEMRISKSDFALLQRIAKAEAEKQRRLGWAPKTVERAA